MYNYFPRGFHTYILIARYWAKGRNIFIHAAAQSMPGMNMLSQKVGIVLYYVTVLKKDPVLN